ncbi:LAETG motif-containing sortase-dependent surface protein [Streptomyces sp. NPDC046862]|uniref:LAETG motif-containing sortase-dependent surface protein n=1 Tax=Streptomyces sp. NPDC046862 TaxID=3154603 RepID=UPI0034554789
MKLRRTLSAAATTAAIVPAALLAATAAHAEGGPSASPSLSATPSATPSPSASTPAPDAAAASRAARAEPAPAPTPCRNGPYSAIKLRIEGVPGTIVAGSGWHTFTLNVANTTGTPLGTVNALVGFGNGQASENGDLQDHSTVQFWDADSGKWQGPDAQTDLTAHESADLKYRVQIDDKATPGDSYAEAGGNYVDPEKHCTDGTTATVGFDVLAPDAEGGGGTPTGSATPTRSQTPTPTASTSRSADATPTADASQGATSGPSVNGNLAETGSSSALPMIGAVGGLAVVAGAGAMIVVRRRRKGDAQA